MNTAVGDLVHLGFLGRQVICRGLGNGIARIAVALADFNQFVALRVTLLFLNFLRCGIGVCLRGFAGVCDLLLFLRVRPHLFQLVIVTGQGLAILDKGVKMLGVILVLQLSVQIARLPDQGVDFVDDRQGVLRFSVLRLLGGHVGAGLAADQSALGIHRLFAGLVALQGGDSIVVKLSILVDQAADFFRFLGQLGIAELVGDLVNLIEVAGQLGQLLLRFLVDFVLLVEHVVLLFQDGLKSRPLDAGGVLHGTQAMVGKCRDIGLDAAKHDVADHAQGGENRQHHAETGDDLGTGLQITQHRSISFSKLG